MRRTPDLEGTLHAVGRTVDAFESRFGESRNPGPSLAYFRVIGTAVGAFRFRSTSVDKMFKLGREKESETHNRIIKHLGGAESGTARNVGAFMRTFRTGSDVDA